jgi:diguanylate cyclase (GGDEF)-like protein
MTTEKEESRWMVEALTRLVNFSAEKLKVIEYTGFADAVVEFLFDDFFQYKSIRLYTFNHKKTVWELLTRRGDTGKTAVPKVPIYAQDKIWKRGKYLYNFFRMDEECNLLMLSAKDESGNYSEYEHSFLSMLMTLSNTFYHMKKLDSEMQKKVIEITNIRASIDIINGLKENKITLEEAILELYESLSLDSVILAVPDETGNFTITLHRGTGISTWEAFVELLQQGGSDEECLELFTMVDSRHYNYGILSCRLSGNNPSLYAIQLRVLENIIPQVTLVLSEQRMSKEAVTDSLTSLFNRRYVQDVLKNRESLIKTDPRFHLSIMMMDVDRFKNVNDTYGHKAGDEVLKVIAGVIKHVVRDVDVVGRYGGEEFIVLMHSPFDIAVKVAERIRKSVERTQVDTGSRRLSVTVSIGLAPFTPESSHEQVVKRADEMLYKAKNSGRNKVVY